MPIDYKEFSAKIKKKYPAYVGEDDYELAQKIIKKYPVYENQVNFDLKKKDESQPTSQTETTESVTEEETEPTGSSDASAQEDKKPKTSAADFVTPEPTFEFQSEPKKEKDFFMGVKTDREVKPIFSEDFGVYEKDSEKGKAIIKKRKEEAAKKTQETQEYLSPLQSVITQDEYIGTNQEIVDNLKEIYGKHGFKFDLDELSGTVKVVSGFDDDGLIIDLNAGKTMDNFKSGIDYLTGEGKEQQKEQFKQLQKYLVDKRKIKDKDYNIREMVYDNPTLVSPKDYQKLSKEIDIELKDILNQRNDLVNQLNLLNKIAQEKGGFSSEELNQLTQLELDLKDVTKKLKTGYNLQEQINVASGLSIEDEIKRKEKLGTTMGYISNTFYEGVENVRKGVVASAISAYDSLMLGWKDLQGQMGLTTPEDFINELGKSEDRKKTMKEIIENINNSGLTSTSTTTPQYMESEERGVPLKAVGFTVGSVPGMAAIMVNPYLGFGVISEQVFGGIAEEWVNNPDYEKMPLSDLLIVGGASSVIQASLEKLGLDVLLSKTPFGKVITDKILQGVMKKVTKGTTRDQFYRLIAAETNSLVKNGSIKILGNSISESFTEGGQQIVDTGIKALYNKTQGKPFFQVAKTGEEAIEQIGESMFYGLLGGNMMSTLMTAPQILNQGIQAKGVNKEMTEILHFMSDSPELRNNMVKSLKMEILQGRMTKSQAQETMQSFEEMVGIMNEIPSNINKKGEAFDLILEKNRIENSIKGKSEELTKPQRERITQINKELETLTTQPVEEEVTEEVVEETPAEEKVITREDIEKIKAEQEANQVVYNMNKTDKKIWSKDFEILDNRKGQEESSIDEEGDKIDNKWLVVNKVTGEILYATSKKDAQNIVDTAPAYAELFGDGTKVESKNIITPTEVSEEVVEETPVAETTPPTQTTTPTKKKNIYFRYNLIDAFEQKTESNSGDNATNFRIEVDENNPNQGKLFLEPANAKEHGQLKNNFEGLKKDVASFENEEIFGREPVKGMITTEPGIVRKEGKKWIVTKKIKTRLVLDIPTQGRTRYKEPTTETTQPTAEAPTPTKKKNLYYKVDNFIDKEPYMSKTETKDTNFRIEIDKNNSNKGKLFLEIADAKTQKEFASTMVNVLQEKAIEYTNIEVWEQDKDNVKGLITVEPGVVTKQGDRWTVTKKAKAEWVLDLPTQGRTRYKEPTTETTQPTAEVTEENIISKTKEDAISEPSTESVDVQESTRDSETVGEGDVRTVTETQEEETKIKTKAEETKQKKIDEGVDILANIFGTKPTPRKQVDERKKDIDNARKSLSKVAPEVEIVVHETDAEYRKATGEENRSQSTRGSYNPTTKTIDINLSKAADTTVAHETFHALLLKSGINNKQAEAITSKMLAAVKKVASPELLKRIEEFSNKYDTPLQSEESIAELFGILASEYNNLPKPTQNIITRWLNRLAKLLRLKSFTDVEVIDLLNTVSGKVRRGEVITEEDITILQDTKGKTTPQTRKQMDSPMSMEQRVEQIALRYYPENGKFFSNQINHLELMAKLKPTGFRLVQNKTKNGWTIRYPNSGRIFEIRKGYQGGAKVPGVRYQEGRPTIDSVKKGAEEAGVGKESVVKYLQTLGYTQQEIDKSYEVKKVTPKKVEGVQKRKRKAGQRLMSAGKLNPRFKEMLEGNEDLNYTVENQNKAIKVAEELIKDVGIDQAYEAVKKGNIRGGVATAIEAEMLVRLNENLQKAEESGNENDIVKAIEAFNEMTTMMMKDQTEMGQRLSMWNKIFKTSILEYNLDFVKKKYEKEYGTPLPPSTAGKLQAKAEQIKKQNKKVEKLEKEKGTAQENQDISNIENKAKRETAKDFKSVAKGAFSDFFSTKPTKTRKQVDNDGVAIIISVGEDIIKQYKDKGVVKEAELKKLIAKGVKDIKAQLKEKGIKLTVKSSELSKKFNEVVRQQVKKIKVSKTQDIEQGRIKIPKQLLYDLVLGGVKDINTLTNKVYEVIEKDYTDLTLREVRDAITGYGKQISETKDEIKEKIASLKMDGRQLSKLEDLDKGKRPRILRRRREYTQEQRKRIREIRQRLKALPLEETADLEKFYKSALESYKTRLSNRLADLKKAIEENKAIPKKESKLKLDKEAKQLKEQVKEVQKEYDAIFKDTKKSKQRTIDQIVDQKNRRLADLRQGLAYLQEKGKEREVKKTKKITSPEIENLNKQIKEVQEEYQALVEAQGIAEAKQIENAKKYIQSQIKEYQERIKNKDFSTTKKRVLPKTTKELSRERIKLKKLKNEFADEVERAEKKQQKLLGKTGSFIYETVNLGKGLLASIDFSAAGRQGIFLGSSNPKEYARAFKEMHKAVSEEKYNEFMDRLEQSEYYPLMLDMGLSITDTSGKVNTSEERFLGNWLKSRVEIKGKNVNVLEMGLKASERAYSTFLNSLRSEVAIKGIKMLEARGMTFESNPEQYKALAKFINNATGRGQLTSSEGVNKLLNTIFFSPRMLVGNAMIYGQMIDPRTPGFVRKQAAKTLLTYVGYQLLMKVLLGIAMRALIGAFGDDDDWDDVELFNWNILDTDFNKILWGDTRYDTSAGQGIMMRTVARLIMGMDAEGEEDRGTTFLRFLRNKMAPGPGLLLSVINQKNPANPFEDIEDATAYDYIKSLAIPLTISGFIEDVNTISGNKKELSASKTLFNFILNTYGVNSMTYQRKKKGKSRKKEGRGDRREDKRRDTRGR